MNYRNERLFDHSVFKVSELVLWKKYMVSIKSCCNQKKFLFVLFNATAEYVNSSLFLKNLEKDFCNFIHSFIHSCYSHIKMEQYRNCKKNY